MSSQKGKCNKKASEEQKKLTEENIAAEDEENTSIIIKLSDLQMFIRNEVSAAVKSLNEDISSRFDNIQLQMERLSNQARNEIKWIKTELPKIATNYEETVSEKLQFKSELIAIRSSLEDIKTKTNPQTDSPKNLTVITGARQYADAVKAVQKEEKNRDERKFNLKITGLTNQSDQSDQSDLSIIKELLHELSPDRKISSIKAKRFPRPSKPDIVVINFSNVEDRNEILKRAHNLRKSKQFPTIYLSEDLTREQENDLYNLRMEKKRLNEEAKASDHDFKDWFVIRKGKTVQLSKIQRKAV